MGLLDRRDETPDAAAERLSIEQSDVALYKRLLLDEVDLGEMAELSPTQQRARLERVVGRLLTREGPVLTNAQRTSLIRRVVDEALGLGVLEPLLADERVTEIMVNGHSDVWVERDGRLERVDARFASEAQLYQTIDRIVSTVNRRVDESSPMVDARLPSGERVNVIIPPLSLSGPVITIRRFPQPFTLDELITKGSLDRPTADLLAACVRARASVVVAGGTGSGKTTFLNALSGFIPTRERIVTIEDAAELRLQQPHVVSLEARPANVEGRGEITIRDLVRNALRMRPDRIIVGEVRGPETLDMLQAMNTGHDGSLATVHANSPADALSRLETLASMTELNIAFEALRTQVASAVQVLVQLARFPDGSRKLSQVSVLDPRRRDGYGIDPVVLYTSDPFEPGRPVSGTVVHHPLPASLAERLRLAGMPTDPRAAEGVRLEAVS